MTRVDVPVRFLGALHRAAGRREARIDVEPGTTVLELLTRLAERLGPAFAGAVFRAPGEVHTHVRVFVDQDDAGVTDRITPDGDHRPSVAVLILPIFEGGSR